MKLYENDVEGDDYLGQQVLEPGSKDRIMEFAKDGARYRLSAALYKAAALITGVTVGRLHATH